MHKIFKLCGSPPDDYWKKSKLPHATLFKPQHPYQSSLWETFKDQARTAVCLIETLLAVEPYKRGTASSALSSEVLRLLFIISGSSSTKESLFCCFSCFQLCMTRFLLRPEMLSILRQGHTRVTRQVCRNTLQAKRLTPSIGKKPEGTFLKLSFSCYVEI